MSRIQPDESHIGEPILVQTGNGHFNGIISAVENIPGGVCVTVTMHGPRHTQWHWHGPKQGTECECGEIFYPKNGKTKTIVEAWRWHVYDATGQWPNEGKES